MLKFKIKKESILRHALYTPNSSAKRLPFYMISGGHFKCGAEYFTERMGLNQYLLVYTLSGRGYIKYKDIEYTGTENCAFLIDCREYHYYKTESSEWEFLWIHFCGMGVKEYLSLINGNSFYKINMGRDSRIKDIILEILSTIEDTTQSTDIKLSLKIHSILTLIALNKYSELNEREKQHHRQAIENTLSYINLNYPDEISIDTLAKNVNISKYYLVRLFKQFTGQTPYSYLINCRINSSKKLLMETDYSIKDIAFAVGFGDAKNYIKTFKKLTGTTPLNFRLYWT